MHPDEQAAMEQDQAEGMRSQLMYERDNFMRHLKEWAKFDETDAEGCLNSVIREFYTPEREEVTEKDDSSKEVNGQDLPF